MANPRLAGIASVAVDGTTYMLAGELEYGVSNVERETLTGQDAVHGYSEKPVPGYIAGTFRDNDEFDVLDFNGMTDVTVQAELANGKVISGSGMWTVSKQEVKTTDGTFQVRFEGPVVETT